jgi:hypothetical protein
MTYDVIIYGGMALVSPSGQYMAKMQYDGNFVVFNGNQETGTVVWASGTNGNNYVTLQYDGNLLIYSRAGALKWASNAYGSSNASLLNLRM